MHHHARGVIRTAFLKGRRFDDIGPSFVSAHTWAGVFKMGIIHLACICTRYPSLDRISGFGTVGVVRTRRDEVHHLVECFPTSSSSSSS